MKSSIKRFCNIAISIALLLTAAGIPKYAHAFEPISEDASVVVGYWRKTTIDYIGPTDENLVLNPDGTAEKWIVTASSRSATTKGRWAVEGKILTINFEDNKTLSNPFTIHKGNLVFPNIENRRRFWDKIAN